MVKPIPDFKELFFFFFFACIPASAGTQRSFSPAAFGISDQSKGLPQFRVHPTVFNPASPKETAMVRSCFLPAKYREEKPTHREMN